MAVAGDLVLFSNVKRYINNNTSLLIYLYSGGPGGCLRGPALCRWTGTGPGSSGSPQSAPAPQAGRPPAGLRPGATCTHNIS